jgi:hypothetical protein
MEVEKGSLEPVILGIHYNIIRTGKVGILFSIQLGYNNRKELKIKARLS